MRRTHILKLDVSGLPVSLIGWHSAAHLLTRGKVIWSMGDTAITLHGGYNRLGNRSILDIPSIISVRDRSNLWNMSPPMRACRALVFARDEGLCMYCGDSVSPRQAEVDHIIPKSRGGPDSYQNLCSSCRHCNTKKSDRTPEEAGMKLLAVPYAPNPAARLILSGRVIIADQMDYLADFSNIRRSLRSSAFA